MTFAWQQLVPTPSSHVAQPSGEIISPLLCHFIFWQANGHLFLNNHVLLPTSQISQVFRCTDDKDSWNARCWPELFSNISITDRCVWFKKIKPAYHFHEYEPNAVDFCPKQQLIKLIGNSGNHLQIIYSFQPFTNGAIWHHYNNQRFNSESTSALPACRVGW